MRREFKVNVAVIKVFLFFMRARRRGRILNITSTGGFITIPGIAYYYYYCCGSKFALEGISEALGKEVSAFGIDVTAVAPGSFKTDWAGRSMARAPRSISDYDALFDPVRARRNSISGKQIGGPATVAAVMLQLATGVERPPAHPLLSSEALELVRGKLNVMQADLARWEQTSRSTDNRWTESESNDTRVWQRLLRSDSGRSSINSE